MVSIKELYYDARPTKSQDTSSFLCNLPWLFAHILCTVYVQATNLQLLPSLTSHRQYKHKYTGYTQKNGRPGLLPLHKHPVSTNSRYHLVMLLLHGASFLNRVRNSRCTVITDLDTSKRSTQKAFSYCGAILETGPAAPQ